MASLGVSSKEYGSLLIPVIMSKLPTEIRIQIARNSTTDVWNIEDLMKIIKTELEAREAGESVKANDNFTRKPAPSNNAPHKVSGTPTSSTFLSNHEIKSVKVSRISLFVVCTAKSRITPLHAKESQILKSAEKFFKEKTDVLRASALVIAAMNVDQRKRATIANKDIINQFVEDSTRR